LLEQAARCAWSITLDTDRALAVGDAVTITHPASPVSGTYLVLARERDLDGGRIKLSISAPVGDIPQIRLVSQSSAFDAMQYAGVGIETKGGERILTLREDSGAPIIGAAVTLDGTLTRYTDAAGRVSFPVASMPPGEHVLAIKTTDGRALTTTVLIT
jgi:hypothetical protein